MRRTQSPASYVALLLTLVVGVAFMVGVLTHEGFANLVYAFVYGLASANIAMLTGLGAIFVLVLLYGLLRWQNTV